MGGEQWTRSKAAAEAGRINQSLGGMAGTAVQKAQDTYFGARSPIVQSQDKLTQAIGQNTRVQAGGGGGDPYSKRLRRAVPMGAIRGTANESVMAGAAMNRNIRGAASTGFFTAADMATKGRADPNAIRLNYGKIYGKHAGGIGRADSRIQKDQARMQRLQASASSLESRKAGSAGGRELVEGPFGAMGAMSGGGGWSGGDERQLRAIQRELRVTQKSVSGRRSRLQSKLQRKGLMDPEALRKKYAGVTDAGAAQKGVEGTRERAEKEAADRQHRRETRGKKAGAGAKKVASWQEDMKQAAGIIRNAMDRSSDDADVSTGGPNRTQSHV
jgi:hypothetical protein